MSHRVFRDDAIPCGSNGCDAWEGCEHCKKYRCNRCRAVVRLENGAHDDMPGACDECWAFAHKEK